MSKVPTKSSKPPAKKSDEGSEFIVKLSGIKLPPDVEERIANEIGAVVMRELGRVDAAPKSGASGGAAALGGSSFAHIIPMEWRGRYILSLNQARMRDLEIPQLKTGQF